MSRSRKCSTKRPINDAVATVIRDQEEAGLDIVTDGNMWYDDYVGSIGAVLLVYVRAHPRVRAGSRAASVVPQPGGELRQGDVRRLGRRDQQRPCVARSDSLRGSLQDRGDAREEVPVKVSVGAGPINLAWHAYFNHYKDAKELSYALAPIFNAEMKELVAAGAKYLQIEDLGAWMPLFTGDKADYTWIKDVIAQCCDGVNAKIGWHFCFGNAWGNDLMSGAFPEGYQTVLPHFFDTPGINEFVLDYANRNMAGVEFLKNLPKDKSVQVGVLDVRSNAIESPQTIAARIKKVLAAVSPDRVVLSTDCGMKPLARMVAKMKLNSLAEGAAMVRKEVAGV